ncbi:dNTP triphosphohydrolase, partial [bacterium]
MPDAIRLATEARERETLSPHAMLVAESEGRAKPEAPDPIRTAYQRDRDRVLHSKPFRRLKHKTQVFIDPTGDHYRTRLTHTLEVAAVARTIGRALRLNEDLIEAIALAHDVGHPPFGHAGERALDRALKEIDLALGFRHDAQSLRVVDHLLDLNLTAEVRAGIAGHSKGQKDLSAADGEPVSTLEAAVVRISDRVAYLNHDLDDALRSGMIDRIPGEFAALGETYSARLGTMVQDVIANSEGLPRIAMSPEIQGAMNGL